MRKFLSYAMIAALTAAAVPVDARTPAYDLIEVAGTAHTTNLQPLSNANVQIRNLKTGGLVGRAISNEAGKFSFANLHPSAYVVELVDAAGRVLGMTAPFELGGAPNVNVSVVAVAQGHVVSSGGGFSLLGLGPVSSLAVIGAAGAAAVTAVVATRPVASPSR